MKRRTCALAHVLAAMILVAARPVAAQTLSYTHTGFIHGFASSDKIWTTPYPTLGGVTTPSFVARTVNVKAVWHPDLKKDSLSAIPQTNLIRGRLDTLGGRHVLIGHSLGGMESRYAHIIDASIRDRIAAIITVASPHQGAILADSAEKMDAFVNDLRRRVDDAQPYLEVAAVAVSSWMGGIIGILIMANNAPTPMDGSAGANLLRTPTLPDLRTTSMFVTRLNANGSDVEIPRASIAARLDNNKFMPLKILAAATGESEQKVIDNFQKARSWFNGCKVFYYATILGSPAGRKCAWAEKMMGRLDATWQSYSSGTTPQEFCLFDDCFTIHVPRDIPSDGVVPNERSVYPFNTIGFFRQMAPVTANHFTVYKVLDGGRRIADAMLAVGMEPMPTPPPPEPLTLSMQGPTNVRPNWTCGWSVSASGGTPPFTYSWSIGSQPHGSNSPELAYANTGSSFTLNIYVRDQIGRQGTASRNVTVSTSAPTCYY